MLGNKMLSQWGIWFTYPPNVKGENTGYSEKITKICDVASLEDLAYLWNNSPIASLSNYFIRQDAKCNAYVIDGQKRIVNSINIFKKDIEPKWEHPANCKGGYFKVQIQKAQENHQEIYQAFVLHFLGQSFDLSEKVNGIRFISSKSPNVTRYRVEIWVNFTEDNIDIMKKYQQMLGTFLTPFGLVDKSLVFKRIEVNGDKKTNKESK